MNIAICDDEQQDIDILYNYCKSCKLPYNISTFLSASALLEAFKSQFYDLIFLDIEMDKPNGFEVGSILAGYSPRPVIVFTTNALQYAVPRIWNCFSISMQTDNDYNVSKCCQGGSWRDSSAKGSGNMWFNSENDFYKRCHIFWESEPAHYFSFCKYIHIGDKGFNGKYDFSFFISFICTDSQKLLHQFELCGQLYTTCCHYDWRLQNSTFSEKTDHFPRAL